MEEGDGCLGCDVSGRLLKVIILYTGEGNPRFSLGTEILISPVGLIKKIKNPAYSVCIGLYWTSSNFVVRLRSQSSN